MINSKRIRLALVTFVAIGATLAAAPAQAAGAARAASHAQASVAAPADAQISPMRCRDDGQGCPPSFFKEDCTNIATPQYIDDLSQDHIKQRMQERRITEADIQDAVRIGSRTADCQANGRWKYELGIGRVGATLVVIVAWNKSKQQSVAVTSWWN
ncbi:hypothetical protein ACWGE1_34950 [Streptomyces sp. NPDC054932]